MDAFAPIAAQRRAVADLLDGLTPEQWAVRSLCDAWTVHDMVAHLVVPFETSLPKFALAMLRARGDFDRASEALTAKVAAASSVELVAKLRANADSHFTPPGQDWHAPLTDNYVHTQDICIPLGLTGPADPAQWPVILDFLLTKKARGPFVAGEPPAVTLTASDVGWSAGEGPEVSAPAAALVMVLVGRRATLDQLEGPGAATLAAWASGS